MLDQIAPLLLTYDEAPNIGRTLAQLAWAREVLIVDSFSTDATLSIARAFPNVRVVQREFDDHTSQWRFGLHALGAGRPWVLALDADYVLSDELIEGLGQLTPPSDVSAYRAHFRYCVDGRVLRGSLYPPVSVLFRRDRADYVKDGHTQRLVVQHGRTLDLRGTILHDDRKPMSRWLRSQRRYAAEEAAKLGETPWAQLRWPDRVRRVPFVAAPLVGAHCLLAKGGLLDGRPGLKYAAQRMLAEWLISIALVRR